MSLPLSIDDHAATLDSLADVWTIQNGGAFVAVTARDRESGALLASVLKPTAPNSNLAAGIGAATEEVFNQSKESRA